MATTDIEPEGESDIFGVPTAVGLWELSEERMTRIEWQRQTDKTDLDPRDGQEKRVWEWVIVKKADVGGAWRAVLKAGFVDATMADTPQVTMIEQAPETDEGRQQCIDAAVDFMIERLSSDVQEPVGGLTDDEEQLIEEIIAEENAEEIGGWHQVDPEEGRAGSSHETVRQWANEPETMFVAFGFWEREDDDGERGIDFQSRLTSSDDVAGVPNRPLATTAKGLEATLDRTINWLRSHNPNAARAEFSMTIEGGVVKPIVDIFRRFTGKILLEAQGDGLSLRGSRFNAAVETQIPASAMDSYDVQRQGELVVDSDDWWGTMQQHLYGDNITIEAGETDEGRPFLRTQGHRQHQSDPVIAVRSDMGDFGPDAAGFVTTGSDYEEVLEFAREAPEGDAAFGVLDGIPLIVIEGRPVQPGEGGARLADDDVTEAFRARFPAKEIHGEAVVAVAPDHLQEIRKAMPRPSQTDVEFTIAEDVPLLSEYSIDGVDVDVRIALLDPEKIEGYTLSVPAAEIEVPEGEPAGEEEDDEVDEAIEEFAREAVTEGDESEVSIVGTGQDKSVGLHPPPPQEVIDQYPDEKKSDDPEGAFLHELSDVVGQAIDVDKYDNEDVVGTLEYLPGGGWNFHPDPPNLLELPIEPVETTSGLKYTAQRGDVTMAVDDQINTLVEQELGPASRFTEGRRVGTAYVTDVDPFQHRELRDVVVKESLRVEDEDDEFEVEVRVGPSSGSFSRGEPKILFDPSDVAEDAKRTIRGAVREHFSVAQLEEVKEQGGGRVIATATVSADGQVQNIDYEEIDVELTAAIAAEFPDLPLSKAELIAEEFETLADVVEATPGEVMEVKGVGEKTVEKMDLAAMVKEMPSDEWGHAVGYLRRQYGDDHQDRVELVSDLSSFANENDLPTPASLGDEGVLQPLIRYQDVSPGDAWNQIQSRAGEDATDVRDVIIAFAEGRAARGDDAEPSRVIDLNQPDLSVGDYVRVTYQSPNVEDKESGVWGDVTWVEDGLFVIEVGGSRSVIFTDTRRIWSEGTGKESDVLSVLEEPTMRAENDEAQFTEAGEKIRDAREVSEDDLQTVIAALGINQISARHLAEGNETVRDVQRAVVAADDPVDVAGVTDGNLDEVLAALNIGEVVDREVTTLEEIVEERGPEGGHPPEGDDGEEEAEEAPEPPEDEAEPEETASILVSLIGGSKNYNVPGRLPGSVVDEAIGAARDTLGPPGQFDVNDTVGAVTFRGSQVESVDLEAGREMLGQDTEMETAGELIVGNLRLDVPEPPDDWASVHFINRNQANEAGEGDRVVYISPDRRLTVRLDGTRVSNKWSMRVLKHAEPMPSEPSDATFLFGPGEEDSGSERITLTHGNVVDGAAEGILHDNFPTVAEAEEMFDEEPGVEVDEADAEAQADVDAEDERETTPRDGEREADDTDTGPDDQEAAIEKSAPGVDAEIEQQGGEWVVRLTPTPATVQFADDSVIERSGEELGFVVGHVLELWESAVDRQTLDFERVEERRRVARQQVDFTIPRFPMVDEQSDYFVTIEAPAEGRGDKYISIAPTSIVPKDEQRLVLERLERRIGVDGIAALFAATPRGSGNVIGEATFERDRLKVIDWDMERIEELMEAGQDDAPEDFRKPEIGVESTFSEGDEGEPPSDQVVRTSEVEFPTPESADDARGWIPDAALADDDEPGSEVVVYHPGALSASEEERLEEMSHEAWDAEEEDDEPPEDFGRTVEGTFAEEVIEAGEMEEEIVEDDGEDLLELPVHVEDNFHDGNLFAPPANTVRLAVSQQIHHAMVEEVGEAEAFDVDTEVGSAFVTDAEDPMDRDFVRVEADVEEEEPADEAVPEPEDEPLAEPETLSQAEVETIIEQATVGVAVDLPREDVQQMLELRLEVVEGEGISFRQRPEEITVSVGDDVGETIRHALERWEEFAIIDNLSPEDVAEVNQRRDALAESFGIDLPLLDQPTPEGVTQGDIERVVEDATQGLDATVVVNTDADSIRIAMEADRSSQADYSGQLAEVQGQASNPWGAIREALELWEAAVEKPTIEIDVVNRRRRRLSREFDAELPQVEDVKEMDERLTGEPAKGEEREVLRGPTEVLDEWGAIMEDLDTVPIQEERLVGQDDSPVPIEVDESFAQTLDENKRTQIEQGLLVHHTEEVHDDVHAFLAQLLGSEPEDFYDGSQPSDLPGYDLYYRFTLTRSSVPGEWTNPRFPPSTLLDILSPLDGDNILVTARGAPLA